MLLKVQSCDVFQVQPVLVKKQPKFPTRERHMAIRRKKSTAMEKPTTITTTGGEQRYLVEGEQRPIQCRTCDVWTEMALMATASGTDICTCDQRDKRTTTDKRQM
ncbi:Hypothetical predicted protein [Drosophila guanche]|uniref:Uncharacterized protein n=1 Tax=Drosophila guanche TaxID=7266 RepID=A0A3B0JVU9_DROGU|nr:Hypothetical predicted protein [Drosophila guanche]